LRSVGVEILAEVALVDQSLQIAASGIPHGGTLALRKFRN
jgi:hypothetical protein